MHRKLTQRILTFFAVKQNKSYTIGKCTQKKVNIIQNEILNYYPGGLPRCSCLRAEPELVLPEDLVCALRRLYGAE